MIPYQSRSGRFIRSVLGGVIGGGFVVLALLRGEAQGAPLTARMQLAHGCEGRDGWADPAPPARVFGNTWYVGTCGITVLLVTSDKGHVLIDGGPAEAAALVQANIEKLGFRLRDVKWIVSSHEHHDHVAALAELKRRSGARVAALRQAKAALERGRAASDDPQFALLPAYPALAVDRVLTGGETLAFGSLKLTVHATPAHSEGSASWTWRSCEQGVCRTMTYADSVNVISAEGYRFGDHPRRVSDASVGLAAIASLPCGVLLTPHPDASNLFRRMAGQAPLEDARACKAYADAGVERMKVRLAKEAGPAK